MKFSYIFCLCCLVSVWNSVNGDNNNAITTITKHGVLYGIDRNVFYKLTVNPQALRRLEISVELDLLGRFKEDCLKEWGTEWFGSLYKSCKLFHQVEKMLWNAFDTMMVYSRACPYYYYYSGSSKS